MRKIIMPLLMVLPFAAIAQMQEPLDKKAVSKMMDWVAIFTMYSNVELSDKIDLGQYNEVANVATAAANPELSEKISEIRGATFVNIYPKGILQGSEWLVTKLNSISNAQYDVLNSPYITLEVLFIPVSNGYKVTLACKGSNQITQSLQQVNTAMNSSIDGNVFVKPQDAKEKVNKAIFEGLDKLKNILGESYAPKIAIRYDQNLYLNGQTIEVWQRSGQTISLTAVNKSNVPLSGNVTWTNAIGSTATATVSVDVKGIKQVLVKAGSDQINVKIDVKEFEFNVEDILKELLIQVINEQLTKARTKVDSLKKASDPIDNKIVSTKQTLDVREGMTAPTQAFLGETIVEEDVIDERQGTASELMQLKQDETSNKYIELHRRKFILIANVLLQVKIEVLLADIIRDEGSLRAYISAIKEKSPKLISDLILNLVKKPDNRAEIKNIILNYLNEQINEVAAKS